MSREVFLHVLTHDSVLNDDMQLNGKVFHNYSSEERPSSTGPFIILRWGEQARPHWQEVKSFEAVTAWVHYPKEFSNDYSRLIRIMDRMDDVLGSVRDFSSRDIPRASHPINPPEYDDDGYTLSFVMIGARSGDFIDEGFNTITKHASYEVFSRRTE